jgi:spore coat protein A, manganese oxidase
MTRTRPLRHLGLFVALSALAPNCGERTNDPTPQATVSITSALGDPSANQVPLDPFTIPKFVDQLNVPRIAAPTIVTNGHGRVIRREHTLTVTRSLVQMLPPGFPATNAMTYGSDVIIPGTSETEFVRGTPGPTVENIRGVPNIMHWRNDIQQPWFLPVDPTFNWANPTAMEPPLRPFNAFPPGYTNALFPVATVAHTHGLMVRSEFDGTAEQWFTAGGPDQVVGPSFVSQDYTQPNDQPATQLWYHGHTLGVTRLDVYGGLVGNYFIRDPANPLDGPGSPLPSGPFEVPLVIRDRGFFTDGELNFPRVSGNKDNSYWAAGDGANVNVVNDKVWPNLDVQRRTYRFRVLIAPNGRLYALRLSNDGVLVPFTIIGSDGGYLPVAQTVTSLTIGATERADILVDFSQFAVGTQIIMQNTQGNPNPNTLGTVMRFTVVDSAPVPPPVLPPVLVTIPTLSDDAPTRNKVMSVPAADPEGNITFFVDAVDFSQPALDYPLVGSTEQWNLIQLGGPTHLIHLHLIEFLVIERQALNVAAYNARWTLINGSSPMRTRPIFVDPTPFFVGPPIPRTPYETGWKDTVQATTGQITRIRARWAPQEIVGGATTPGVNQFSIDPTTGPGYLIHCHILGHEDHDMLRKMPVVKAWAGGVSYEPGTVVAFQNVDYRVRVAHTSVASQPPNTRFDRWERVNNNDGTWAPQIVYAVGDRVLFGSQLFVALQLHQGLAGQTPPTEPARWRSLPMTACGQLAQFCQGNPDPIAVQCLSAGQAGNEAACLATIVSCMPVCAPSSAPSPCSGICADPISFTVADGTTFDSGNLGSGPTCHETTSELLAGSCSDFAGGRTLTVNGRVMPCNGTAWPRPLPSQRNEGYCLQASAGGVPWASFSAF